MKDLVTAVKANRKPLLIAAVLIAIVLGLAYFGGK